MHWFVTPFIDLPTSVTNVQVEMKYNLRSCKGVLAACSTKATILKKEQNTESNVPNLDKNPFTDVIRTESPDEASLTQKPADTEPKITSAFTVNVQKRGLFLAIRVQSACIALFDFKIFYIICASEGINLVKFPKTLPPTSNSQSINVTGTCVEHALPSQSSTLHAFCNSNGNWTAGANVFCICMAGYRRNVVLNTCEGK